MLKGTGLFLSIKVSLSIGPTSSISRQIISNVEICLVSALHLNYNLFYTKGGRHGLILLWFTDLMNVTEKVAIHRPNVSTLPSSTFIRGDLNATTRGPFIRSD